MKSFALEIYTKGDGATIYSVLFEGETNNEVDKFITKYYSTHKKEIDELLILIDKAADKRGMQDQYCRFESSYADGIVALPGRNIKALIGRKPKKNPKLRLYVLRLNVNTVVLYSGAEKNTSTYQEDPVLLGKVTDLQTIEELITERLKYPDPEIKYRNNDLIGNLYFEID